MNLNQATRIARLCFIAYVLVMLWAISAIRCSAQSHFGQISKPEERVVDGDTLVRETYTYSCDMNTGDRKTACLVAHIGYRWVPKSQKSPIRQRLDTLSRRREYLKNTVQRNPGN